MTAGAILNKEGLKKKDIEFIVDRIVVYTDHIDIQLRSDIDALLHVSKSEEIEKAANGEHSQLGRKVRNQSEDQRRINTVCSGDPQLTVLEPHEGGTRGGSPLSACRSD